MSSIALDRTQTQVYIPESGQTTLENVQKTASTATPSVTVENVKSRDADTLNTGRVKVQPDAPNAAVSDKVTDLTLKPWLNCKRSSIPSQKRYMLLPIRRVRSQLKSSQVLRTILKWSLRRLQTN